MAQAQFLHGFAELSLAYQSIAEVAVGLGIVLLEADGLAVLGDCLV
jgi:hypothetical protein